jgi:class 3 adenylate cyclase
MPPGSITVYPDTAESYTVELKEGTHLPIGRRADPSGREKLVIPVPEVSSQHAEIRHSSEGWTIRDSGSTNGTRLNGERLSAGKEYQLHSGDRIRIAQIELLVWLPGDAAPRPAVEPEQETHEKTHLRIQLLNATILVVDIQAFTSLMEQHADSPEIVMEAAQRVFEALSEEIKNSNGQLEKILGDAIMAYWQEDEDKPGAQAIEACSSALRLHCLVGILAQNPDIWPFSEHALKVDLALATGPVAAGALGHKEANPALLGDTANLAFRIEKLIDDNTPSNIIVDAATYQAVKNKFKFVEMGQVSVKGRLRPVDLHCLIDKQGLPTRE